MAFGGGNATRVTLIKEVTYGVTPATPVMQIVPFTSFGLNPSRDVIESNAITGNRQKLEPRSGNNNVAGDLAVELQHGTFDVLLESLFANTFTGDELKIGNTQQSMSIEASHTDIGQYRQFTGVVVSSASIDIGLDGQVTASFTMMGKDSALTQASIASSESEVAKTPYIHFDGVFNEGGSQSSIMTAMSLTIDNALTQNYVLGMRDAASLTSTSCTVNGSISIYFENQALVEKFLNDTQSSISFVLTDPSSNAQTWTIPKLKYSGAEISVGSPELIVVNMPFNAYYDSTDATTIKINRTP